MNNEKNVLGWDEAELKNKGEFSLGQVSGRGLGTSRWRCQWAVRSLGLEFTKWMMAGDADSGVISSREMREVNEMRINEFIQEEHVEKSKTNSHSFTHVCVCSRAHTGWQRKREVRTFSCNDTFYISFLSRRRMGEISASEAKKETHFKKEGAEQSNWVAERVK